MNSIIYDGCVGIPLRDISPEHLRYIKSELTLIPSSYQDDNPDPIIMWDESDKYLWVPRHYLEDSFVNHLFDVKSARPTEPVGEDFILDVETTLQPARGQPEAVTAMIEHLRENHGGILQAYTGCGKTICGYTIAAFFGKAIGVFVYNQHMMDNWIKTAQLVFGLEEEDIGVVQGDRCDLGKPVTVMMIQSLYSRDYPDALYSQMGVLIADEVNRFAAPVWQSTISMFPATYRLGMSADPSRKDGLDDVITWNFGKVAYKVPERVKKARPLVVQVLYKRTYSRKKYVTPYGPHKGEPNAVKYRKMISQDFQRNEMMVAEMVKARKAGRKALIFTQFRAHAEALKELFTVRWAEHSCEGAPLVPTRTSLLIGGIKKGKLEEAMTADFIFTTYSFSRDALNLPHIDTVFFSTPCGDPLQPIGRLRDTGPEKKSLLAVDFYEHNDYSMERARRRRRSFADLGLRVQDAKRSIK